jgi:hypothetical protein
VELVATPNTTLTTALGGSGVTVTVRAVDGHSSFAEWWCSVLSIGGPASNSLAAALVTASAPVAISVSGVAAVESDGRCVGVVLGLRGGGTFPHRGSFDVELRVASRAFACYMEEAAAAVTLRVEYAAVAIVPPGAVEAAAGATAGAALPVGSVGGAGLAAGMQRALLQMRLAACDFSLSDDLDVASNPLQLSFGMADGAALRGSVVGNTGLLVAVGLLAIAGAAVRQRTARAQGREMTLARAGSSLALPGWMVAPAAVLLQPLVSSGVALVVHSGEMDGGGDVAIGVLGLAVGSAMVCSVTLVVTARFCSEAVPYESDEEDETMLLAAFTVALARRPILRRVAAFVRPRFEWRDVRRGSMFTKRFRAVFEAYGPRRQWFMAVEFWVSGLSGVVGGVMPSDGGTCFGLLVTLCTANCALLCAMCLLRPYNAHVDFALSGVACLTGALWGVMALAEAAEAAVVLSLIGLWVSMLSLLLLIFQMMFTPRAARGWRRLRRLFEWVVAPRVRKNDQRSIVPRTTRGGVYSEHQWERLSEGIQAALSLPPGAGGNLAFLVVLAMRSRNREPRGTRDSIWLLSKQLNAFGEASHLVCGDIC